MGGQSVFEYYGLRSERALGGTLSFSPLQLHAWLVNPITNICFLVVAIRCMSELVSHICNWARLLASHLLPL